MKPTIIAIANHKGGVGKTTTARLLLWHWAQLGHTALAIDLDPQANLSSEMKINVDPFATIGECLMGRKSLLQALQPWEEEPNISLVATDIRLNEVARAVQAKSPNHNVLYRAIQRQRDLLPPLIVIDCAPAADILTANALYAADYVIIPCEPHDYAVDGMSRMVAMTNEMADVTDRKPSVLGCLITRYNPHTVAHQEMGAKIATPGHPPVLGIIQARGGVDAPALIRDNYATIASAILAKIGA